MLPSMPLISTPYKELQNVLEMEISPESRSPHHRSSSMPPQSQEVLTITQSCLGLEVNHEKEGQGHNTSKALDLSATANISSKKSSPLKHVTPILKKYNTHRKGKGTKKLSLISKGAISDQLQLQQGTEKQFLHPIAPRPVKAMLSSSQQDQQNGNPRLDQVMQKHVDEDVMDTREDMPCVNEITNRTQGGHEENEGTSHDEKISEEKDVSAGQKDCEDELSFLMSASTTIRPSKGRTTNVMKKKSKQLRDMESTLTLLRPDNSAVKEEKSYGFAQAYFLKVKERLEGTELYQEFLNIMNEFGTSILDVSDLYKKITALLKQHPDLCEEFVAFLLPEQAMQCGKFMEYLMITKMRDFFRKLEIYYEKQPQQMQKIYTNLSELSNEVNVSVGDVRNAILPLLKGNSLLIENFLALLPYERPPESLMPEFEEMDLGDVDNEQLSEEDLFETLVVPDQQDAYGGDNCACTCHSSRDDKYRNRIAHCMSCGTRFIHGKVYLQTGRGLRPAKVVFDAEGNSDSINRLSAKSKPKARNRRRALSLVEAAGGSKDNSPVKHTNQTGDARSEVIEHGGVNNPTYKSNIKSSSPKHVRTAKTKSSGSTLKGREKANVVNTVSTSKAFSNEEKESSGDTEEQKQSGSACCNRLNCDKQIVLSTKPVVLLHNISSSFHSISMPKTSYRNSNSVPSPTLDDRAATAVTDPVTVSSVPNAELHNASNTVLPIPAVSMDGPNLVSPAVDIISSSQDMSSPEAAYDESAILPPDTAAVDSSIKDFGTLSHVIHGGKDATFDFGDKNRLLSNVEKSGSPTGETRESVSCEDGYISREVTQILEHSNFSDMEVVACDVTMNDVTMSEHEDEESALESVETQQEDEFDRSQQTHCNSDSTSGSWTREEDKIILQMFQLDCSMDQTFIKISEQLPLRTLDEIRSRFQVLMALLQQMTGAKMEEDSNSSGQ
ncbi:hypothetical protein B7P43_G05199 [Cryptotermes secundus]|uniref:Myb-like domain-containing protein n=1 Tax=Cryptotermes secundus TaxID=105785 RepID=A0A2J7QAE9_9NEOP|nr:uncharacterized protein LOC111868799 isoform X1 [Cryptotermes secundus]XP_033609069.1 uncharacterized protein LOC111868799 isoform X1 [Cryptotermes secundus]XP_033609071.1 uncharacterized protein LOC111868799 isoform X1 [Cryptotermes secundus]PNF25535.1 hypothetical protein B7P43_G05199 [Cryptotermes secundus]PNF25539.1 hypothetical protein B7P43_G05199 [Cryptotermes secundus]